MHRVVNSVISTILTWNFTQRILRWYFHALNSFFNLVFRISISPFLMEHVLKSGDIHKFTICMARLKLLEENSHQLAFCYKYATII